MPWLLILFAIVASALNTIQSGSNAMLTRTTMSPVWSTAIVFAVALATTILAAVCSGQRLPSGASLAQLPWWAWIGGMFGAVFVLAVMLVAEKVGAAVFTGVTLTAAVLTSLVMDHYGLVGFEVHRAGLGRVIGGCLMMAGLFLVARF